MKTSEVINTNNDDSSSSCCDSSCCDSSCCDSSCCDSSYEITYKVPSFESRVLYYLGSLQKEDLLDTDIELKSLKDYEKTISPNLKSTYFIPFQKLLKEVNCDNKKFLFELGDIRVWKPELKLSFVKNRYNDTSDGIILQSFNFTRHWKNFYQPIKDVVPFKEKKSVLFWRGSTTGDGSLIGNRFQLVEEWFEKHKNINVGFTNIFPDILHNNFHYPFFQTQDIKEFKKSKCSIREFFKYKYILSVRGNDKDSGLQFKLNSTSVVFMCKPRVSSWLMETLLIPNYHYVLLKDDFSDLKERVEWADQHQDEVIQISKNANRFMRQFEDKKYERKIECEVVRRYFQILNLE